MIDYTVKIKASAQKELRQLDKKLAQRILIAINNFATGKPCDIKKMQGTENKYRIRVNQYRVLVEVLVIDNIAYVYKIAHRREVYKNLP